MNVNNSNNTHKMQYPKEILFCNSWSENITPDFSCSGASLSTEKTIYNSSAYLRYAMFVLNGIENDNIIFKTNGYSQTSSAYSVVGITKEPTYTEHGRMNLQTMSFAMKSKKELLYLAHWSEQSAPLFSCSGINTKISKLHYNTNTNTRYALFYLDGNVGDTITFSTSYYVINHSEYIRVCF